MALNYRIDFFADHEGFKLVKRIYRFFVGASAAREWAEEHLPNGAVTMEICKVR